MKINQVNSGNQFEVTSKVPSKEVTKQDAVKHIEPMEGNYKQLEPIKEIPQEDKQVDQDVLKKSVEQANKTLKQYNRYIERQVHEVTHAMMYTLRDTETKEVIAEFPPKKLQDMIAKMWELAGLFVDEKA